MQSLTTMVTLALLAGAATATCSSVAKSSALTYDFDGASCEDDDSPEHVSLLQGGLRGAGDLPARMDEIQSKKQKLLVELKEIDEALAKTQGDQCPTTSKATYFNSGEDIKHTSDETTRNVHSILQCGEICDRRSGCNAFKYSSGQDKCTTYMFVTTNGRSAKWGWTTCLQESAPPRRRSGRPPAGPPRRRWDPPRRRSGRPPAGPPRRRSPRPPAHDNCPYGYYTSEYNLDGTGKQWTENVWNIENCAQTCGDRHGCTGFEYSAPENKCGTYTGGPSNIQSNYEESPWVSCLALCPPGYISTWHNLDGMGKSWDENLRSIGMCSEKCDYRPGCTGFEYDTSQGKCGTYTGGDSNIQSTQQQAPWISCVRD